MSDVDVIIQVHTQGVQQIANLSSSLRNLHTTLRGISVPMSKLDTQSRAVYKALGITSRGVNDHAKSIRGLVQNQKVLSGESRRLAADLKNLKNTYALVGRENTELGRQVGQTTRELKAFSATFRGMRLRAIGSDFQNISLRLTKIGKDAQFVGRSLLINLTLPLATFARTGLQTFLAIDTQLIRLTKVLEGVAPTLEIAAQKMGAVDQATGKAALNTQELTNRAQKMVSEFNKLETTLTNLSLKFGVSKDLVVSISADFAELGLTAAESITKLAQLTLEIEKLGTMDIGPAQDLSQALYFQSRRALEATGSFTGLTSARQKEIATIKAATAQLYLFNAIENVTALTLRDLGDAFPEVASTAISFGLSMTEAAALLAPMKAAGLDVGASANSIKVSLQRLVAPTKQNVDMLQKLAKQFGVAEDKQNSFMLSTKTGLIGLEATVKLFDAVREGGKNNEAALRVMSELFEKRQGPRMYLAIEQLSAFNAELRKADSNFYSLNSTSVSAEVQLVRAAEAVTPGFKNFNSTIVPKTIRSFKDIGNIARIATAKAGITKIEIEPGKQVTVSAADVANAKAMRQAVSDFVLKKKQAEGIDIISEVDTEAGRALMVQLAGATNAAEVAQNELKRSLESANTSIQVIKNAFKMFAADIVRDLIPTIQKLAKKVEEMYDVWSSPEFADTRAKIIKFITAFGGFLALLGPTILALGTFNSVVGNVGRGMSVLFPKLKNVNGEFVGIGQTARIASDSINNLYRRFMDLASARASGPTGAAASARALVADAAGPGRQFISSTTDLGTATARGRSIQKALLSEKGIVDIEGGPSAADQEKFFSRYLRTRPTATRIPTSAAMGAAYGVPAEFYDGGVLRPELASRFDDYRTLSVAERRKLSPTAGRRLGKRQLAAVQRFQESQDVFGRKGVGIAQTISDKGTVGPMRYAYRGQDITRDQARNIARGGLAGIGQRAALRAESVRDVAMAPVKSIKRATDGMKEFKNTFTGLSGTSMGTFAKLQVSTTAYFTKLKGGQAALDALILKHKVLGLSAPGAFKQMGATILGVVKNMKLATIATKIFRMALMMTGIGAIIAGVAAVVFLVIKNLDKIKGAKKGWDALRKAFDIFKSALMEIVRPIQDLFAMFGSGSDEGAAAGDAIAKAFDKIGLAVKWLAGMFKMLVEKIIKPYLYGVVNVVMAVVEMFKGNWGGALKYLIAAFSSVLIGIVNLWEMLMSAIVSILAGAMKIVVKLFFEGIVNGLIQAILLALRGIVNLIGKIPGMKKIMDPINNAIKKGGSMVSDGMKWISDKIGGGIDFAAGLYKKAIGGMANFAKSALKKGAALGVKESTNEISKGKKKMGDAGKEAGEAYDESIANALGGDAIDEATDKVAGKLKEGIMDAAQKLQDFVRDRFSGALKKFISDTVNALQKQKEAALKVFDVQINTLMKLEKAEESLTRKKEYETNRRKLIDDATLRKEQYRRNRALAIYENRIDDARLMDVEEQVASRESDTEIASLDESRRKELAKENLDALREAINEAKELAGKFFDEQIQKFQQAADKITEIGPVTIEQYTAQLNDLKALSTKYADENNVEFGKMFEKFSTTIAEKMPNAVDDFGKALGAFTTPLDELVALAEAKYGLGSEDEATVLGVTHAMSKAVIGVTLGMLVDIGDTFATEAPNVVEKYGLVTGGMAGETGTFKTEVLGVFNTLLEETKTAFLTPYKTAFDEADPTAVFREAIRLGNLQIQRDFENTLEYNKELFKKMRGELDATTLKWVALKAAIDAANDAASGGGGAGGTPNPNLTSNNMDAETRRFLNMKANFAAANPQSILLRSASGGGTGLGYRPLTGKEGLTGLERYLAQTRDIPGYKDGGPIPLTGMPLAPYGLSGFLNAPTSQAIPAILHGGEFVVNADAVKRIGLGALAKLNDPRIPKFKKGGLVGASAEERRQMAMKPQAKATLPYTTDRMEKLVSKQVPTGPVDRIERQIKGQREAVNAYLKANSTPEKDNRNLFTKALDFVSGIGAQGGIIDRLTKTAVTRPDKFITEPAKFLYNAATLYGEQINAALPNKIINLAGRAMGKNPNLREAGFLETLTTGASVALDVLTLGASSAQRMSAQAIAKEAAKMASKKTTAAAIRGEIVDTAGVVLRQEFARGTQLARGSIGELMPGAPRAVTNPVERIAGAIPMGRPIPGRLPSADLSEYLFHGGPKAENLFGGVVNPEFIRGGKLWNAIKAADKGELLGRFGQIGMGQPSVLREGTQVAQGGGVLNAYETVIGVIKNANKYSPEEYVESHLSRTIEGSIFPSGAFRYQYNQSLNKTFYLWKDQVDFAIKWLDENKEIVERVMRGESHATGVIPSMRTGNSAYEFGGIHLLKVPAALNPRAQGWERMRALAQGGALSFNESPFWGIHKPIASAEATGLTSTAYEQSVEAYRYLIHKMIEDANQSLPKQMLEEFALSQKVYGNQITPGARAFIVEELGRVQGPFGNFDEIQLLLQKATSKEEMLNIVKNNVKRKNPRGWSTESDKGFDWSINHMNKVIDEFALPRTIPAKEIERQAFLDSIIHSGMDAFVLGVVDDVYKITYREALQSYYNREILSQIPEQYHQLFYDALAGVPIHADMQVYKGLSASLPKIDDIIREAKMLNPDILGINYRTPILEKAFDPALEAQRAAILQMRGMGGSGAAFNDIFGYPRIFRSPIDDGTSIPPNIVTEMQDKVDELRVKMINERVFPSSNTLIPPSATHYLPPSYIEELANSFYHHIVSIRASKINTLGDIRPAARREHQFIDKIMGSSDDSVDIEYFRSYILRAMKNRRLLLDVPQTSYFGDELNAGYLNEILSNMTNFYRIGDPGSMGTGVYGLNEDEMMYLLNQYLTDENIKRLVYSVRRDTITKATALPNQGHSRIFNFDTVSFDARASIPELNYTRSPATLVHLPDREATLGGLINGEIEDFAPLLGIFKERNQFHAENVMRLVEAGYDSGRNRQLLRLPLNLPSARVSALRFDDTFDEIKRHEAVYNALANVIGLAARDYPTYFTKRGLLTADLVPETLQSKELWTAVRTVMENADPHIAINLTDDFLATLPSLGARDDIFLGLDDMLYEAISTAKVIDIGEFYGYPKARSYTDSKGMELLFDILKEKAAMIDSMGENLLPYESLSFFLPSLRRGSHSPMYFGSGLSVAEGPLSPFSVMYDEGNPISLLDNLTSESFAFGLNTVGAFDNLKYIRDMARNYNTKGILPDFIGPNPPKTLIDLFEIFKMLDEKLIKEGLDPQQFLSQSASRMDYLIPMMELFKPYLAANNVVASVSSSISPFAQRFAAGRGLPTFPLESNSIHINDALFQIREAVQNRTDYATPSDVLFAKISTYIMDELADMHNAPLSMLTGGKSERMPVRLFQGSSSFDEGVKFGFDDIDAMVDALNPYDSGLSGILKAFKFNLHRAPTARNLMKYPAAVAGALGVSTLFKPDEASASTADQYERNTQSFYGTLRSLSEFIAGGESLNTLDPYSAWAKPGAPGMIMPGMTSMKLGEVIEAAQGHAVGKYQNMPKYLKSRAKVAGFNIGTIFSPEMQEQLMISTLMSLPQENGLGLISYLTGKVSQDTMVNRIANMWRSISGVGGMYVGGGTNPKGFDPSRKDLKVRSYLDILKATYPGYKMGGYVPGSPSTAIPAILHGGEYVINAKAVQQLGMSYLSAMNAATGSRFRTPSSRIGGPNAPVTQSVSNITIQVENFIGEEQWFNTMMDQYNVKVLPKNQKAAGLESRKFTSYNGINQGL